MSPKTTYSNIQPLVPVAIMCYSSVVYLLIAWTTDTEIPNTKQVICYFPLIWTVKTYLCLLINDANTRPNDHDQVTVKAMWFWYQFWRTDNLASKSICGHCYWNGLHWAAALVLTDTGEWRGMWNLTLLEAWMFVLPFNLLFQLLAD